MRNQIIASAFLLIGFTASPQSRAGRIINGVPVPKGHFSEVVPIRTEGATCTATVVGPRTLLTAAHCIRDKASTTFHIGDESYTAKAVRHPDYPTQDYDIAVLYTEKAITNITPANVSTEVDLGESVYLLGYGCINPGGGGGNDGVLRIGESTVTEVKTNIISQKPDGGAACFGDSGGPTYVRRGVPEGYYLVGVQSKGDIKERSWSLNLGNDEVIDFLSTVSANYNLVICGINKTCSPTAPNDLEFKAPQFQFRVKSGENFSKNMRSLLTMPFQGPIEWSLDSSTISWITVKGDYLLAAVPDQTEGTLTAGVVARSGDDGAIAMIRFVIDEELPLAPQCKLVAEPAFIELGQPLTLRITTIGTVNKTTIEGKCLNKGVDHFTFTPPSAGVFVAKAEVKGPGGTASCTTRYAVK